MSRLAPIAFIAIFVFHPNAVAAPSPVAGIWDATVTVNKQEIPFRIEFAVDGNALRGWLFNGEDRVTSTGGSFEDGRLTLEFAHYATRLEATVDAGKLVGQYLRPGREPYAFHAVPHTDTAAAPSTVPNIAGEWEIAVNSPKGEAAWRLLIRQNGAETSAVILRVDGDTGTLTGAYRDERFVLSHFSGARPAVLVLTPQPDDSLGVDLSSRGSYTALRPAVARAKGLAAPTDPGSHTSLKDPSQPLRFRFHDLSGREVSESDPQFTGKVVLINITGSWCPNCHDEAPFLAALYRKYHRQGLEIVALSFEEAEQLKDPACLRAFIRKYDIDYTVLLAGEPFELQAKLPQAAHLNSWPTTFFVGRDGRVRHIHAGFAGLASGPLHEELKRTFTATLESLLSETLSSASQ